jgi:hypothetical protein
MSAIDWIAEYVPAGTTTTLADGNQADVDAQAAIWYLAVNQQPTVTDFGGATVHLTPLSSGAQAIVNAALAAAASNSSFGATFEQVFSNSTTNAPYGNVDTVGRPQDLVWSTGTFNPKLVPEFGTLASFGGMIATGGLALLRRRRRAA